MAEKSGPPNFEQALSDLEGVVRDLEEGQLGLEDSLGRYEKGVGLLKHCHQLLQKAEHRVRILTGSDEHGEPQLSDFNDNPSE